MRYRRLRADRVLEYPLALTGPLGTRGGADAATRRSSRSGILSAEPSRGLSGASSYRVLPEYGVSTKQVPTYLPTWFAEPLAGACDGALPTPDDLQ